MVCKNCGAQISKGDKYCPNCGQICSDKSSLITGRNPGRLLKQWLLILSFLILAVGGGIFWFVNRSATLSGSLTGDTLGLLSLSLEDEEGNELPISTNEEGYFTVDFHPGDYTFSVQYEEDQLMSLPIHGDPGDEIDLDNLLSGIFDSRAFNKAETHNESLRTQFEAWLGNFGNFGEWNSQEWLQNSAGISSRFQAWTLTPVNNFYLAAYTVNKNGEAYETRDYRYGENGELLLSHRVTDYDSEYGAYVTDTYYDENGNVVRIYGTNAGYSWVQTNTYDDNQRLLSSTEDGVLTRYSYAENGNLVSEEESTDSQAETTYKYSYKYNDCSQIVEEVSTRMGATSGLSDELWHKIEFTYSEDGNMKQSSYMGYHAIGFTFPAPIRMTVNFTSDGYVKDGTLQGEKYGSFVYDPYGNCVEATWAVHGDTTAVFINSLLTTGALPSINGYAHTKVAWIGPCPLYRYTEFDSILGLPPTTDLYHYNSNGQMIEYTYHQIESGIDGYSLSPISATYKYATLDELLYDGGVPVNELEKYA